MSRNIRIILLGILLPHVGFSHISFPQNLLQMQHSPAPYECAVLSGHAYKDDLQAGDPVVWVDPSTQQVHALHGWTAYKVLTENSEEPLSKAFQQLGLPYGYRGVIYLNARKKQLVLAHRGTDLKNMSAIKTDARSIAQNVIGGQERLIPLLLDEAIKIAHQEKCSLAVTGHSLGGWLAQITAFIAKAQYPETHVRAITFDSPGARPMLEQINPRINPIPLDQLDITNYLSSPNLVNACNPHLGTVYRVVFEQFNPKQSTYTLQSHGMQTLIQAFDPSTGDAYQSLGVHSWPLVAKKSLGLAGQMITGDKINAILALCQLLKRYSNQELLGEYSGFFKFAKQVNRYHPKPYTKTGKDAFDLAYKYHYHTTPFTPKKLHIRHLPEASQQFLKRLYAGSKVHAKVAEQDQFIQAIAWNQQTGWVHTPYETDLRLAGDQLLSTALSHPELTHIPGEPASYTTLFLAPPAVSFFVDREQALKALKQCFQGHQDCIIAPPITGPGGIGKTQLALRVVNQQTQEAQYDHVFWIPADSEEKLINAYLQLAAGLHIYVDKKDAKQAVHHVRLHLKDKHCLYVFDDAPDIGMLHDFLPLSKGHVLITSRGSSASDWPTKPLVMTPFGEQEAISLARAFGFVQEPSIQASLKPLLANVPRYPLTLVQLFSTLERQGISPQEFLTAMQHYTIEKQDQTLLDFLSAHPHIRVGYAQGTLYVFKSTLDQLAQEAQGQQALQLLSQLGYLDSKGIPVAWLLTWDQEDTSFLHSNTRSLLSLLEKYSLIQWDRASQQVYIHAETQLMVRHFYPQPTLTSLIHRLVDYVGPEAEAPQNAAQWVSLLPHGRVLFKRLDTAQYPSEAYVLTQYLAKACEVACLFKEGFSWAEKRLQLANRRYPCQDHPDVAYALNSVGWSLGELGNDLEALKYYKQSLSMRQRLYVGQDHSDIAWSLNNVGWTLGELGNNQEALSYHQQALSMRQQLYPDQDHPDIAWSFNNMGYSLGELGNDLKALAYYKQSLSMRQRLYKGQDHPYIAQSFSNVGWSLGKLGSHEEALSYHKQALSMRRRLYKSQDHPYIVYSLNNMGYSLGELGSYEEALSYQKEALEIHQRLYPGQDHPHSAIYLCNVGWSLGRLGHVQESLGYFKQALAMSKRLYPERDHPLTARILYRRGGTLVYSGAYQKGLAYHQDALAMQKRLYPDQDHPYLAETLHSMGEALEGLGKLIEAVAYYNQALCMVLRIYQKAHPHITQYLKSLIGILNKLADQALIQQTKDEVVPLCNQWLGENHALTQQLRDAGK